LGKTPLFPVEGDHFFAKKIGAVAYIHPGKSIGETMSQVNLQLKILHYDWQGQLNLSITIKKAGAVSNPG